MGYTLKLTDVYNNDEIVLNMGLSTEGIDYSISSLSGSSVFCDHPYKVSVIDEESNAVIATPTSLYLNDEEVFLDSVNGDRLFQDLFGVCRIEVIIGGVFWISDSVRVLVKDALLSRQVKNMVYYIYDNCEQFIYEDHKFSKLESGFKESENTTIDSKLALLEEINKYYSDSFQMLRNSPTNELVLEERIEPIEKIQYLNSNSLRYIATHPDELMQTGYNTGIIVNRQRYMPTHALSFCFVPTMNTYENQIVVGFIYEIIADLKKMLVQVDNKKNQLSKSKKVLGYIDSCYEIMLPGIRALEKYQERILKLKASFTALMSKYMNSFLVDFRPVKSVPKKTIAFRSVPIYNKIFILIMKWFRCGSYDMRKTDFILGFLSTSKIYEYYTLIKLKKTIESLGYSCVENPNKIYKYPEYGYYRNTRFQNTFEFSSETSIVNLYFQPVIFATVPKSNDFNNRPNGIALFRSTTKRANKKYKRFSYYTPDFVIAHKVDGHVSYHILDAKFSTFDTIEDKSLADLVFKYIFSLSTINESDTLDSLCLIFGKEQSNSVENIHDVAEQFDKILSHNTYFVACNGQDVDDNNSLSDMLQRILTQT